MELKKSMSYLTSMWEILKKKKKMKNREKPITERMFPPIFI